MNKRWSQDNTWQSVLFFHYVKPRERTQVSRFPSKHPYTLRCITGPDFWARKFQWVRRSFLFREFSFSCKSVTGLVMSICRVIWQSIYEEFPHLKWWMVAQVSGGSRAGESRMLLRAFLFLRLQSVKQHVQNCEITAELLRGTVEHGREPPGWPNRSISGLCSLCLVSTRQKNLSVCRCRLRWLT